jgi:hypothetical protein
MTRRQKIAWIVYIAVVLGVSAFGIWANIFLR